VSRLDRYGERLDDDEPPPPPLSEHQKDLIAAAFRGAITRPKRGAN
jgi:hypothetical protein